MKIIKRVEPKSENKKITCFSCTSKLEYSPSDIHSDQREGDWIVCPVCKAYNQITI